MRHAIARAERVDQHAHPVPHERQPVGRHHRAGHVDQEHQIARRHVRLRDLASLQPDEHEPVLRVPGRLGQLGRDRERHVALRLRVVEAEVVDHLLDANRAGGGSAAVVQEPPDVRVRRGVDVDRERRERLVGDAPEHVFHDRAVGFVVRYEYRAGHDPGRTQYLLHIGRVEHDPLAAGIDHEAIHHDATLVLTVGIERGAVRIEHRGRRVGEDADAAVDGAAGRLARRPWHEEQEAGDVTLGRKVLDVLAEEHRLLPPVLNVDDRRLAIDVAVRFAANLHLGADVGGDLIGYNAAIILLVGARLMAQAQTLFPRLDPDSFLPPAPAWSGASETLMAPATDRWVTPSETTRPHRLADL